MPSLSEARTIEEAVHCHPFSNIIFCNGKGGSLDSSETISTVFNDLRIMELLSAPDANPKDLPALDSLDWFVPFKLVNAEA